MVLGEPQYQKDLFASFPKEKILQYARVKKYTYAVFF